MPITVKRARMAVEFCPDLDLWSEWQVADAALQDELRKPVVTEANVARAEKSARVTELESRIAASLLIFTLEALPKKRWAELCESHPAREDNVTDATYGLNVSAGADSGIPESIVSVTQKADGETVDFDPAKEWDALADEMSQSQYDDFVSAFLSVNKQVSGSPFSRAASRESQS